MNGDGLLGLNISYLHNDFINQHRLKAQQI